MLKYDYTSYSDKCQNEFMIEFKVLININTAVKFHFKSLIISNRTHRAKYLPTGSIE